MVVVKGQIILAHPYTFIHSFISYEMDRQAQERLWIKMEWVSLSETGISEDQQGQKQRTDTKKLEKSRETVYLMKLTKSNVALYNMSRLNDILIFQH
jgi:hypothetical protein